ncbi:LEM domain-containing protein [Aphelenchoides besseyi]|nr:LEM domain-containing protein [Aphelenchoides besseyi]
MEKSSDRKMVVKKTDGSNESARSGPACAFNKSGKRSARDSSTEGIMKRSRCNVPPTPLPSSSTSNPPANPPTPIPSTNPSTSKTRAQLADERLAAGQLELQELLRLHFKPAVARGRVTKCPFPGCQSKAQLKNNGLARRHFIKTHGPHMYLCRVEGCTNTTGFQLPDELTEHDRRVHGDRMFFGKVNGWTNTKRFSTQKALIEHHRVVYEKPKLFCKVDGCERATRGFGTEYQAKKHHNVVHVRKACDVCGEAVGKARMHIHKLMHIDVSEKRLHMCPKLHDDDYKSDETLRVDIETYDWAEANDEDDEIEVELVYYCYLLFNVHLLPNDVTTFTFDQFVRSIFYVGKGKGLRCSDHFSGARDTRNPDSQCKKHIKSLWAEGKSVIPFRFHPTTIEALAYTIEASMIDVLLSNSLVNVVTGDFYVFVFHWNTNDKWILGRCLLLAAFTSFVKQHT